MLKLNETPVRTSRNFRINNIKLEDIELPEKLTKFNNIEIKAENSKISENVSNTKLRFGTGKELEENIIENANNKLKIETTGKKENIEIIYKFDDNNLKLINNLEIIADGQVDIIIKY